MAIEQVPDIPMLRKNTVTTLVLPEEYQAARRSKLEVVAVTTAPTIGTRSPQLGRLRPPVLPRTVVSEI